MKGLKRRLLLRAAFFILLCLSIPYFFLMALATTKEFRDFAESKASRFLNAEVRIGRIRVGVPNRVILSNFQVKQAAKGSLPGFAVQQIIFRYSLKQLLSRNLRVPSSVLLKSPRLSMGAAQSPFTLIQDTHLKGGNGNVSEFEMAGGEIRYEIPVIRTPVLLKDVRASFFPQRGGDIRGVIQAHLQGVLEGDLELSGLFNPESNQKNITGRISSASFNRGVVPSSNSFDAQFSWVNDSFRIESLRLRLPHEVVQGQAQALNLLSHPVVTSSLNVKSGREEIHSEISADFSKNMLNGYWMSGQKKTDFSGKVLLNHSRVLLQEFTSSRRWVGDAALDYGKGEAVLNLSRDEARFSILARVRDNEADLDIKADHMLLSGHDIVTSARVHLSSDPFSVGRTLSLEGSFSTDYFILDTLALEDFKGDFQLSSSGLNNISGSWGKVFKTVGSAKWDGRRVDTDLTVRISSFDLSGVKKFADKPLPKDMGGLLSGKIKIQGPAERPRLAGRLTVKDGWLGKVDFEKAIIQFDGLAPFFKLVDSRVYRGRGTLLITGNLDLQADNILHAVTFETQDHIVLYRGLDVTLTTAEGDVDLEIHPGIKKLPAIGVKSTGGANNDKDERTKDRFVEIGPRFKF